METTILENDIKVFYKTASSFPAGVLKAHQDLHQLIPFSQERRYFGLSRPENDGDIVYRAATAELTAGEAEKLGCDTLLIKKGAYVSILVEDYMTDIQGIEKTFQELLLQPGLDPQGYCVEWYVNEKDVLCMIRLQR